MQARLLNYSCQEDVKRLMHSIGVDYYGLKIMQPKGILRVIYLSGISSFSANILKQELLSLGAELAIPREALLKERAVDCVLFGSDSQIAKLLKKLLVQPSSLRQIGCLIKESIDNFRKDNFLLKTPYHTIKIAKPLIMGILNVTPDSFSQDGLLKNINLRKGNSKLKEVVLRRTEKMVKEGADLIDVGGQSSRPGSMPVSIRQELQRVIPAIKIIKKNYPKVPLSVDTYRPQVAMCAIEEGASIVNDITALASNKMARIVARKKVGIVLMHMKGRPRSMQKNPFYKDVLKEIYEFLSKAIKKAARLGINKERVIIDVGIGFGKRLEDNMKLVKYLYEFKSLGRPILIGLSRKSFIGALLKKDNPQERLTGTLAGLVLSVLNGAKILRVHDVKEAKEAIKFTYPILCS